MSCTKYIAQGIQYVAAIAVASKCISTSVFPSSQCSVLQKFKRYWVTQAIIRLKSLVYRKFGFLRPLNLPELSPSIGNSTLSISDPFASADVCVSGIFLMVCYMAESPIYCVFIAESPINYRNYDSPGEKLTQWGPIFSVFYSQK